MSCVSLIAIIIQIEAREGGEREREIESRCTDFRERRIIWTSYPIWPSNVSTLVFLVTSPTGFPETNEAKTLICCAFSRPQETKVPFCSAPANMHRWVEQTLQLSRACLEFCLPGKLLAEQTWLSGHRHNLTAQLGGDQVQRCQRPGHKYLHVLLMLLSVRTTCRMEGVRILGKTLCQRAFPGQVCWRYLIIAHQFSSHCLSGPVIGWA